MASQSLSDTNKNNTEDKKFNMHILSSLVLSGLVIYKGIKAVNHWRNKV